MKRKTLWVVLACALVSNAHSYDVITHSAISDLSVRQSALDDPSAGILDTLCAATFADDRRCVLPSSSPYTNTLTPLRLIREGAVREDDGVRALNHFFDPQQDGKPLTYGITLGDTSPDWALEDTSEIDEQGASLSDAKEALYAALTGAIAADRARALGQTFESLGHVMHHLQDMAQPQHVRNDVHCDRFFTTWFYPLPAPGACPFAGAYRPSAYEGYTKGLGMDLPMNGYTIADVGTFGLPRDFWQANGKGIAEFTSNNFDYFFRGRIEIGLPEQGVYGVLDHATTYAAGQGFDKLKLRLRNVSPDGEKPSGEKVPQTIQGGTLVAIAKYTLNSCYQPDLSGDYAGTYDTGEIFAPANCSWAQYLAGEEQIVQSTAILAASLDTSATEFVFDFASQPIPVNARDLRIQVVYTGTLGSEPDAIAFGGRDISEPTHLVIYNNSDYFALDGKLYTPQQIQSDPALAQRVVGINIDPKPLMEVTLSVVDEAPIAGPSPGVGLNGYLRVAVLADPDEPINLNVKSRFEGTGFSVSSFSGIWPTVIDLRSAEGYITPYGIFRDPRGNFFDVVFKANSNVPLLDGELITMSGRQAGDPGPTPIPVEF